MHVRAEMVTEWNKFLKAFLAMPSITGKRSLAREIEKQGIEPLTKGDVAKPTILTRKKRYP